MFLTLQRKAALPREQAAGEESAPPLISVPVTFADNAIVCCAGTMGQVLIRRDALAQTGPLNVKCVPCDDWELYLRLGLLGVMAKTERNVIWWRSHASNTSKNHQRMYNAEMRVRQCLLARADLTPEQRRQVRDGFQVGKKRLAAQQCGYAWEFGANYSSAKPSGNCATRCAITPARFRTRLCPPLPCRPCPRTLSPESSPQPGRPLVDIPLLPQNVFPKRSRNTEHGGRGVTCFHALRRTEFMEVPLKPAKPLAVAVWKKAWIR